MKPRFCAFIVAVVLASAGWSQDQQRPLLLVVEQTRNHAAYHLDSVDVTADPLRGLGLAIEKHGQDWPLTIAVDSRVSIKTLWNAAALAGKAGFVNVRYYAFHHHTRTMKEVSFGKDVPLPIQNGPN